LQRSLVLRLGDQLLHPMALLLWVARTLTLVRRLSAVETLCR
jgi:hypothetical protein